MTRHALDTFIRIQAPAPSGTDIPEWRTIPNCEKLRVWETSAANALDPDDRPGSKLHIFHIGHIEGITKGDRVVYPGTYFSVVSVSESTRMRGLELRCTPIGG